MYWLTVCVPFVAIAVLSYVFPNRNGFCDLCGRAAEHGRCDECADHMRTAP